MSRTEAAAVLDVAEETYRRWDEAYEAGKIDLTKYADQTREIGERRRELEGRVRRQEQLGRAGEEMRRQRDAALNTFGDVLASGDEAAIARGVRALICEIVVREGAIEIAWR